ncbi:MAG: hypothetical protein HY360_12025 [Verrucomicrobia bacterium]|nr:hypothetical protein [Verrucomicrobiota bacterium]
MSKMRLAQLFNGHALTVASWKTQLQGISEWVFMVPNNVERFTVKFTGRLTNPSWKTAALGKSLDETQTIEVKPEHRGRLWRYRFGGHGGAVGAIKLEGIPPFIAAHPDWWFPLPAQ